MRLSTRDENASSYDGVECFPAKKLLLVCSLVHLFRNITTCPWQRELIAPVGNVSEGGQDAAFSTIGLATGCGSLKFLSQS
jgi:hypothetical protein